MRLNRDGKPFDIHSDAIQWRIKDQDNFIITAVGGSLITISDADVARAHPDLPQALRLGVQYHAHDTSPQDHVHKAHVRATYQLLNFGHVEVTDLENNSVCFIQLFEVENVNADVVSLYGSHFRTVTTLVDGRTIPYVINVSLKTVDVDKRVIETLYPNWQERLTIGESLQMNKHACMRYAFSKQTSPHIAELPNISFAT